jgi:hypothetical protein
MLAADIRIGTEGAFGIGMNEVASASPCLRSRSNSVGTEW